jgi:hypothetical protein
MTAQTANALRLNERRQPRRSRRGAAERARAGAQADTEPAKTRKKVLDFRRVMY